MEETLADHVTGLDLTMATIRRKPAVKPKKNGKAPIDWQAMRRRYIEANLDAVSGGYTLKLLSGDCGVAYTTVKIHALEHNDRGETWRQELRRVQAEKADAMIKRTTEIEAFNEVQIRLRHIKTGRMLQERALLSLTDEDRDWDKLQFGSLLSALAMGVNLEQRAAALPATYTPQAHRITEDEHEDPRVRMARYVRYKALSIRMFEAMALEEKEADPVF